MNGRRILGLVSVAALALGAMVARAESPAPDSAAAPAHPAPASAPAVSASLLGTPAVVPADAPALDAEVPGAERTPAPSAEEWRSARPVRLTRRGPMATSCGALRVREWVRVRCQTPTFAISLLGGSNDGLSFWIGGEAEGRFGEVQFPLRRGDRRVVQLWRTEADHAGAASVAPSVVLQELWPTGDAAPTITVL